MNINKLILIIFIVLSTSISSLAQCYPDRHNSTWFDGWVSCEATESPNPERGISHWIMYDFNHIYGLGEVHLWNTNDRNNLSWGLQYASVDYSVDGINWTELGTYTFEMASGRSIYQGFLATNFDNNEARFVLITALENWGGDCYGLAEIRFEVTNTSSVTEVNVAQLVDIVTYPNPFRDEFTAIIKTTKVQSIQYSLIDMYGRAVMSGVISNPERENQLKIVVPNITNGIYHLVVTQGDKLIRNTVVKVG